ncbi:hypothetical protein BBJ28_00017714 [Nothophytophthora sp. Chile5]|nr:hypothetical protein BBJ28_00017714 [Nothophytophthora sp. Chile5]
MDFDDEYMAGIGASDVSMTRILAGWDDGGDDAITMIEGSAESAKLELRGDFVSLCFKLKLPQKACIFLRRFMKDEYVAISGTAHVVFAFVPYGSGCVNQSQEPDVEVVHEPLDMSLLHEVRKFTIKHATTTFDWIVLTAGMLMFGDRSETVEGLDVKMSTMYYGRYGISHPKVIFLFVSCRDLMAQAMSEHAPLASFMHIDPGFVRTNLLDNSAWYIRLPMKALSAVLADSPEHCAEIMMVALAADGFAGGWKLLDKRAKELPKTKFHTGELKDAVWEHTLQTIDGVLKQ